MMFLLRKSSLMPADGAKNNIFQDFTVPVAREPGPG